MEAKELKELLSERLHFELQLFKDSVLSQSKEVIYKSSYKIEIFINVYEILMADISSLEEDTVRRLLYRNFSILESLYQEWLTKDDSIFDELKSYVGDELKAITEATINIHTAYEKEGSDGEEFNKTA